MKGTLAAARATGRPLVTISGPAGIGRTTFLARLYAELTECGTRVSAIRFTRQGLAVPAVFAGGRPAVSTPGSTLQPPGMAGARAIWSSFGLVAGAHDDPAVARRAAVAIASAVLSGGGEAVLLVDDAQWIDRDCLAVLEVLAQRLAGSRAKCVCAVRTPTAGPVAEEGAVRLRRLYQAGLLRPLRLRPWTLAEISRRLTELTQRVPDPGVAARLGERSRGIPAVAIDLMRQHVDAGTSVDHEAASQYDSQLVEWGDDLGPDVWTAAKVVSVLAPLGEAVPIVLAEVMATTEPEAVALLDELCRKGLLHRGRTWRISVPHFRSLLAASLGPFERRHVAATTVTAVWAGAVACADADYLADLVADAGRLVDAQRALTVLLERAAGAEVASGRVQRWLDAAVELTEDGTQRADVLFRHMIVSDSLGDNERIMRGARRLLADFTDRLSPDAVVEVWIILACALYSAGDRAGLREIAGQRMRPAGDPALCAVVRAFAYSLLDRWDKVRDLLARTRNRWHTGSPASVMFGLRLESAAALWTGDLVRFEEGLTALRNLPMPGERHRVAQIGSYVTGLLIVGDPSRAEKLLSDLGLPEERLRPAERTLLAALRGSPCPTPEPALRCRPHGMAGSIDAASTGADQLTISILVAQGRLTAARQRLTSARAGEPQLAHLLDFAEARIDRALGDTKRAVHTLRDCLAVVAERGLVVGTDLCWAELADLSLETGDRETVRRSLTALGGLAERMPTGRAVLLAGLVTSTVDGDRAAAAECLRAARERGQPFELAVMMERLVRCGVADPRLLSEAYSLYGKFDALLYRAWLRNLMRERGIVVPGRRETLVENERLLALLAAEGLSNKQLAMALRTSEKSVEGRLSRLFSRTGYRSRIELSTAMLNGEYQ